MSMCKEYRYIQRTGSRSSMILSGFASFSGDSSNFFNSAIGGTIMDRLYTLIFFMTFQLQVSDLCNVR
ncbi:unnamed protein product [Trichobilharzia regenti]|nr:unnamed protein product [Trichobilharzia regenti]